MIKNCQVKASTTCLEIDFNLVTTLMSDKHK